MDSLIALRSDYRDIFEKNTALGLVSCPSFLKQRLLLLKRFSINAEIYGEEIIYKNYYDIGVGWNATRTCSAHCA